uniref:N-terminal E2 ubiquitin-conjugating enzyme n=1 Tax=Meloidogyne incognita TaxID=6306 RepID=A0A914LG79_MELIC
MSASKRRLVKELSQLVTEPPAGFLIYFWMFGEGGGVKSKKNTLYEGEVFQLQFKFDDQYPFSSPEVTFIGENIPVHPHVYSNGHICLSILSDDWTPALSISSVCLSIQSMLSSCKEKALPPDNTFYVRTCNKSPNKTRWWFHDDKI